MLPAGDPEGALIDPPAKPLMRGRFHQAAFVAAIPAGVALILSAPSGRARLAAAVYALSLAGLYGTSSAYHRLPWSALGRALMQKLDHSMVFGAVPRSMEICFRPTAGGPVPLDRLSSNLPGVRESGSRRVDPFPAPSVQCSGPRNQVKFAVDSPLMGDS